MTVDAAALLPLVDRAAPIYAILDGARDPRIRPWVLTSRAPAWCLYAGKLPEPLLAAAPHLVRLGRGHSYVQQLLALSWGDSWGGLVSSSAPSRELRRHLRRFLRVRSEEGRVLVFRYYDPRILRIYLPTCTPMEAAQIFGPIEAFACESEAGGLLLFRRGPTRVEVAELQVPALPEAPRADRKGARQQKP